MYKYKFPYHCDKALKMMSEGHANCELITEFEINGDTFYDWCSRYPEFGEAVDRGREARKAFFYKKARARWLRGSDAGYKFFEAIAKEDLNLSKNVVQNQVNIGNVNLLDKKSDTDLIAFIESKIGRLPIEITQDPIDTKLLDVLPKTDPTEDE